MVKNPAQKGTMGFYNRYKISAFASQQRFKRRNRIQHKTPTYFPKSLPIGEIFIKHHQVIPKI
jgi:hypothetical protein